jgi:predicted deacylase
MRTVITLNGLEHPAFELTGAHDGPRLSLIGGIHGCEYSSIAAVTRVMRELDPAELHGTITAVPVVSMESFTQRSAFVVPADGKNLNRSFPGDPAGSYTDRLAHDIFTTLIEPADALIDLHGGDLVEALEPFALYSSEEARQLALAFNLPYVIDSQGGSLQGMTAAAAAQVGIPGVIAEAGGIGQLDPHAVGLLTDGTKNALRQLEMLPGDPAPSASKTVHNFVWVRCTPAGFWEAAVTTGDIVSAGDTLGVVKDLYGDTLETLHAPEDGVILFLTTSAAVAEEGLLLGLGAE